MATRVEWVVTPLSSSSHSRAEFSCGNEALDSYIRQYASQDVKRNVARVFVACRRREMIVKGYYTLSAASFRKEGLPPSLAKNLPRYPVPAAIIGRMAVDRSCQRQGLGEAMLMDACRRVLEASQVLAVHAIVVEAKDEAAKAFYVKYGFISFVDQPLRLFIPLSTIEQLTRL